MNSQLRGISCGEGQQKGSGGEGEQTAASAAMVPIAVRDSCKVESCGERAAGRVKGCGYYDWLKTSRTRLVTASWRVLRSTYKIHRSGNVPCEEVLPSTYKNTDLVMYQHKREKRTSMQPKQQPSFLRGWGAVVESTQIVTSFWNSSRLHGVFPREQLASNVEHVIVLIN